MEDSLFIEGLLENNKEKLSKISKIDIHNHGSYSCTRKFLENNGITIGNEKITNIQTLIEYSRKYITPLKSTEKGLYLLLKGNFENCINTGIKFVSTNIDFKDCVRTFNSDVSSFIEFLKQFEYDSLKIQWIIEISRDSYKSEYKDIIMDLINSNFFAGIDLVSTENCIPNSEFVCFYEQANKLGLITKVHAGEQLGAEYIKECINDFNPKEIQHGINIVEDEQVMELAKEKNIIFNVCPSSNLILGYVKSIAEHPVKKMYEFGLKVTIATDDLLYFNNDINDEYLNLYNNKVLTAEDLNKIRKFGMFLVKGSEK